MGTDGQSGRDDRITKLTLLSYGLCALLVGGATILAPGRASLIEAGSSSAFVAHLDMSRAASLAALGLLSLSLIRAGHVSRYILAGLALSNVLTATILGLMQGTPAANPLRWVAVALCLAWAIGFAWSAFWAERDAFNGQRKTNRLLLLAITTYVLFTGATGLVWLLAPGLLGATLVQLGGASLPYFALVRGAADLPLACIAWGGRNRLDTLEGRSVILALVFANLVLAISGLLAQLESIATPSRWIVEGMHVFWLAVFALQLRRSIGRAQPSDTLAA